MTAQKFSDKRGLRYFGFLLRQNWPALVTNSIVLLLINVVIYSMALSDLLAGHTYIYLNTYDRIGSLILEYRVANVIFAALLAVLWGCTTMPYLNSKVGVNFHHSLPLKREHHYLYEVGAKVLLFVLPMGVSTLLGYLTTVVVAGDLAKNTGVLFLSVFINAVTNFVLYYAILIFAASFTGTGFGRLLTAGMIVFMPSILLSSLYTICDYSARYSSFTWITDIGERIMLPIRSILVAQGDKYTNVLWELIGAWLIAAVFLFCGLLIYRKRKSELSGTPVLSKIARGLMKYTTIFVAATLFAMMMEDFADGVVGIFIGGAIGALLAAMLMNTILTKSAKNMFAGVRGLVISFAAFCLIFAVVGFDLIGFDTYIPAPTSVRTVTVQLGGVEVELTDRDDVKRVTEIVHTYFQNGLEENNEYDAIRTVAKNKYYDNDNMTTEDALRLDLLNIADSMFSETFYVRVTFKTATGLRFEKRYHAPANGTHEEILTIMANSEDFPDAYFGESAVYVGGGWMETPLDDLNYDSYKLTETYARQLWHDMRVSFNGMQYFNRPALACVMLDGTPVYRYPYYDGNEDAIRQYMKQLTSVYIVNVKTGEMKEYTDSVTMESMLRAGILDSTTASNFAPKDDTYVFFGIVGDKSNFNYICAYFLDGQIPAVPLP